MKTSVVKRVIALILAGLIALGTLGGYLFSVVGYAATNDFDPSYTITKKDNTQSNKIVVGEGGIDIEITMKPQAGAVELNNNKVELDTNKSGFSGKNGYSFTTGTKNSEGNYVFKLENMTYQPGSGDSKKGKLAFNIKKTDDSGFLFTNPFIIDISECETGGGSTTTPGGDDDNNQPSLPSNMTYTIQKIYRSNNNVTYDPADNNKNDPSIHRGYYVDAQVQFSIPNVQKEDIIANSTPNVKILVDRGSFRFQSNSDASIRIDRVLPADGGVICYVSLKGLYYTGSGSTLAFTVESKASDASPYIFSQFSAEVSSCVPYTPEPDDGDDDPDYSKMEMATPYVIVSNYSYGGQVTAGDTFPLELTFYNTSRNLDVTNMMITISMPDAFMLTSSSNTFYVDQLDAEQSVTQTVQVTAKANAAPQSHNIEVSMKYQYIDDHLVSRRDNSTQETISIPVVQIDRFQVTGVEVSQEIYLNEESYLTVNFVNKGRSDVYNLSAQISGDIQNPGQQQNLGNLTSGSTGTADFYITPNGEGVCTGEVTITYEDTNMEEKTATIQWSTNAVDPMAGMDFGPGMGEFDPGMMEDPTLTDEKKSPTPFIIGGVVIAAGVAAFLIRRRILKKRSEEADANL